MHNRVMRTVRQGISLPTTVAAQVRAMAIARRLSANRMLLAQIENGIAAEKQKQQAFFEPGREVSPCQES